MSQRQKISITLPETLLNKIKELSRRQEKSLTATISGLLEETLTRQEAYEAARLRHLTLLAKGFDLGTAGAIGVKREELHDRP